MPPRPAEAQDVDVTVFAPPMVPPGEEVIVQVKFHTPEREAEAAVRAQRVDTAAAPLASIPLTIQVRKDDEIRATLECDEAKIAEPVQHINWNGRLGYCYFTLKLPPDAKGITRPRLRVFVNGVPAGCLIFQFQVKAKSPDVPPAPANQSVKSFRKPFLSYASQDRVHVLKAAQLLDALNMKYFQDILSLSPGERSEKRLYEEIKNCDVFLLFWSHNARASEWVIREAEFALQHSATAPAQDGIEIVPVLLEGPPAPLPPASLGAILFNDPIRHIIFAEENVANARTLVESEALDRLGENIERLFRTPRGPIARMKDGTAIARVDEEFKRITSVFERENELFAAPR